MLLNLLNKEILDVEERYSIYEDNNINCYYTKSFYNSKLLCGQGSIIKLISDY